MALAILGNIATTSLRSHPPCRRAVADRGNKASTSRGSAGDPRHDVTFREVSRSAVPSRTAEPTYLFGALVVVVKCDLPTYPDGATGDNGPPIRQGAGTLNRLVGRCVTVPPINLENNAVERSVCVGTAHWGDAAPRCWSFLVLAFKGDRPAPSREARRPDTHTHKPRRRTREALTELIRRGSPNA